MLKIKHNSGLVLPTVIVVGILMLTLALAVDLFISSVYRSRIRVDHRKQCEYSSYAGIQAVLFGLRNKTEDSIDGIIDPHGNNAGFVEDEGEATLIFDLDAANYSNSKKSNISSRVQPEVTVIENGKTLDGLRKRYRIIVGTSYGE